MIAKINKWLSPLRAKHVLCVLIGVLILAVAAWVYSKGETVWPFILIMGTFLLLLIRGVFWANLAIKYLVSLIAIIWPFIFFYRYMFNARIKLMAVSGEGVVDYTEAWIYFFFFEMVCMVILFLLNRSKQTFDRLYF